MRNFWKLPVIWTNILFVAMSTYCIHRKWALILKLFLNRIRQGLCWIVKLIVNLLVLPSSGYDWTIKTNSKTFTIVMKTSWPYGIYFFRLTVSRMHQHQKWLYPMKLMNPNQNFQKRLNLQNREKMNNATATIQKERERTSKSSYRVFLGYLSMQQLYWKV